MPMNRDIIFYTLVCSIFLQTAAAVLVLRLAWLTRTWSAWVLIALVLGLMTVRRAVTLIGLYVPEVDATFRGLLAEGIALAISILLLLAIVSVGRLIKQLQAERQAAEGQAKALAMRTRQLSTLYAIDRVVAHSLNRDEILNRSLESVMQMLEIESASILLLEPDGETLTVRAHQGLPEGHVHSVSQVKVGEGLAGQAVAQGTPITVGVNADASERMAPFVMREGFKSMASTPLVSQGRPVGALNLGCRAPRKFSQETLDFLVSLGQQLGAAVDNASLYEAEQARRRELDTLLEVTRALGSSLDLQTVATAVTQATHRILSVERCAVFLWDETAQELVPVLPTPGAGVTLRLPPAVQPQFVALRISSHNAPLIMERLLTGQPVVVGEVATSSFIPAEWVKSFGIQSALAVPLFAQEHFVGGLYADYTSCAHQFTSHEVDVVLAIAGQAALALQNARLFETLTAEKRRLELLYDLSQGLTTSLDAREVAVRALDLTTSALGTFKGELFVQERDNDRLRLIALSGFDAESVEALDRQINLRVGQGLAGYTACVRTLTVVPEVTHDNHWRSVPGVDDRVCSAASLPLVAGDELVGVINLLSDRENFFRQHDFPILSAVAVPIALALQNARLFEASANQNRRLRRLYELAALLTGDPQTVFDQVAGITAELVDAPMVTIEKVDRDHLVVMAMWVEGQIRREGVFPLAGTPCEKVTSAREPCRFNLVIECFPDDIFLQEHRIQAYIGVPLLDSRGQVVGVLQAMDIRERAFTDDDEHFLEILGQRVGAELERQRELEEKEQLFAETRRRANEFAALYDISRDLAGAWDLSALLQTIVERAARLLAAPGGGIYLYDAARGDLQLVVTQGLPIAPGVRLRVGEGLAGRVVQTCQPLIVDDYRTWEHRSPQYEGIPFTAIMQVPMLYAGELIGVLAVHEIGPHTQTGGARKFTEADARLLALVAAQAASAVRNARLFEETGRRLEHITALHAVDMAITASHDLPLTLDVLLNNVTAHLGVDAASILLLNAHAQTLEYAAGRGFRTTALQNTHLRLGEGSAGRAALERRMVGIPDLRQRPTGSLRSPSFAGEAFVSAYAAPLIAKGQVQGVMEIFHRAPLQPDREWLEFLETLAGQAAIAIENAELFDCLQRSNVELTLAYDATIEGWSRALDLREHETERHTQRVTEMALKLARAMGFSESELVHIRRGALLHDIGKMGVPDSILLKPDKLTDGEWEIMRQHPQHARDMLLPIAYLRPALDIPYCHHEKWDGTGYPRGLKGDEIPLAARIFAITDVWDALRSDRPYRSAWPEEKVREYIYGQAGKQFDPQVVDVFFEMTGEGNPT